MLNQIINYSSTQGATNIYMYIALLVIFSNLHTFEQMVACITLSGNFANVIITGVAGGYTQRSNSLIQERVNIFEPDLTFLLLRV